MKVSLDIDITRLDEEWLKQPKMMRLATKNEAQAQLEVDEASNNLELIKARLGLLVRSEPEEWDLGKKPTETAINSIVIQHKDYRKAIETLNEANYKLKVLKGVTKAVEHKKSALEQEVFLWSRDYFSEPKAKGDEQDKNKIKEEVKKSIRRQTQKKTQ